jgi:hypothetical protein
MKKTEGRKSDTVPLIKTNALGIRKFLVKCKINLTIAYLYASGNKIIVF